MIRNDFRTETKRRTTLNHKKQQFALPAFRAQEYPHRLSLYILPPTEDITLEQLFVGALRLLAFLVLLTDHSEVWAIDRLKSIFLQYRSQ